MDSTHNRSYLTNVNSAHFKMNIVKYFLIALVFVGGVLGSILLWDMCTVATAKDAKETSAIYDKFVREARAELSTNNQLTFLSSPRRGSTILFVCGKISDEEMAKIESIAKKIGQENGNRKVSIVFKANADSFWFPSKTNGNAFKTNESVP